MRTGVVSTLLAVSLLVSGGCVSYDGVALLKPTNGQAFDIGKAPGPQFEWTVKNAWYSVEQLPTRCEYVLTVSRDQTFSAGTIYVGKKIRDMKHVIEPGEGWLPGGSTYYWKVEGQIISEEGEIVEQLLCMKPRSFSLDKRELVELELKMPDWAANRPNADRRSDPKKPTAKPDKTGEDEKEPAEPKTPKKKPTTTGKIGDESFGKVDSMKFRLEAGESRRVILSVDKNDGSPALVVGGTITVVNANDNTRVGKVLIDNLTVEGLDRVASGDVLDFSYSLGGEEIAKLKLGGRATE